MSRKIGLPSRNTGALAVSFVALLVALSSTGVAQAAYGKITSKQIARNAITTPKIKNGAVTSAKVRDRSLRARDIRAGVLPPSSLKFASATGNRAFGATQGAPLVVTSLTLPAGKWHLLGSTGVTNISGGTISAYCSFGDGATDYPISRGMDVAADRSSFITVQGAVNLATATTVNFECWGGSGAWVPSADEPTMSAAKYASLTVD